MNKRFLYNILQYKYSPILNEAVNIGVLFYFPDEQKKLYFIDSGISRVKALYGNGNIDEKYFQIILKIIKAKTNDSAINEIASTISDFEDFVDSYILKKDDSVFQFSNPYSVLNVFSDIDTAIKNYKEILFPVVKNRSNGKKLSIKHSTNNNCFTIAKYCSVIR
jgi:hypothetical protein